MLPPLSLNQEGEIVPTYKSLRPHTFEEIMECSLPTFYPYVYPKKTLVLICSHNKTTMYL